MNTKVKVCVQGLGFVGLAMSIAVANSKDKNNEPYFDVVGLDLPNKEGEQKIEAINNGIFPFKCTDKNLIKAFYLAIKQSNLRATSCTNELKGAEIIIVDINLDVKEIEKNPKIDFSGLKQAIKSIGEKMEKDALVIVETTVPPGTTKEIVAPILVKELKKRYPKNKTLNLAHSYERVMPGKDYLKSITDYWRVFAGLNNNSSKLCEGFLQKIINTKSYPLTQLKTTTASETAKILENSYRASNIAFMNEWGLFAESIGIDLYEVIEAIKIRPTHSNIRQPGFGVGGYCLTKDPLMGKIACNQIFKKNPTAFPISTQSVSINNEMTMNTLKLIEKNFCGSISQINLLLMGLTYKEDVEDTRYSPSLNFINKTKNNFKEIYCHDPLITNFESKNFKFINELPKPNDFQVIVIGVSHSYYKNLNFFKWLSDFQGLLIDSTKLFNSKDINKFKKKGIIYKSIGRGDL